MVMLFLNNALVDKLVYAPADQVTSHLLPYRDVQRGDVIVFRYPLDIKVPYVKRAIGIPGDRLHLENKKLVLNGKPVDEPYTFHIDGSRIPYRDDFPTALPYEQLRPQAAEMLARHVVNGKLVVPPGFIFVMGDNRENSDDSRYWGLVPRENIFGTPLVIYWSFDAPSEEMVDPNITLGHLLNVGTHFLTKTRWARTLQFVHSYPLQR